MKSVPGTLAVWVDKDCACVKISGRATCNSSVDFRALLLGLRERGWRQFLLDLSECQLMDSTFLGVLAGLGIRFSQESNARQPPTTIRLLNPNRCVAGLLENLGVAHLFETVEGPRPDVVVEAREVQPGGVTREELNRTSLEAHRLLIQINPQNEAKFKEVCKFLEEDLKKLQKKEEGSPTPTS